MAEHDWMGPVTKATAEEAAVEPVGAGSRSVEERLARIELLLDADLERLGPAVLTTAISELEARLEVMAARVEGLASRLEAVGASADRSGEADGVSADGQPVAPPSTAPLSFGALGGRGSALDRLQLDEVNRRLDDVVDRLDQIARALPR